MVTLHNPYRLTLTATRLHRPHVHVISDLCIASRLVPTGVPRQPQSRLSALTSAADRQLCAHSNLPLLPSQVAPRSRPSPPAATAWRLNGTRQKRRPLSAACRAAASLASPASRLPGGAHVRPRRELRAAQGRPGPGKVRLCRAPWPRWG
jgi:hypothetical protein